MPHTTFSTGMLNSAMPGLSKLAASLGGGDMAYQAGQDYATTLQSKLAQAAAQINAHNAQAAHANAQATLDTTKNGMITARPGLVEELVAGASGTDVPMVQAIRRFTQTGQRPQVPMGPPTEEGQYGTGSQQFDPATQSAVAKQLMRFAPVLMGAGDVKVDDWAKANQLNRESDLSDSVIADPTRAAAVFKGQAAAGAKPLFHQDTTGAVLDLGGGQLDTANPMATSTIGLRGAQAGQARAAAADHYAGAGLKNAQTAEVGRGAKTSHVQVVTDGNGNITLLDKTTGVARPALGPDGKPMQGRGSAAKLTEDQGKATGWLVQAQNAFNNMQAAVNPNGGTPSAANPGFNDMLAGVPSFGLTGALANKMRSGDRQKFMQGASSLSEALLRAATGAGVNRDEALQKVRELTPQFGDGDDVIKQKMDSIPLYIESLKVRAGPGALQAAAIAAQAPNAGGFKYLGTE